MAHHGNTLDIYVKPESTPNGVGIGLVDTYTDYLSAISDCCESIIVIIWKGGSGLHNKWCCSNCEIVVREYSPEDAWQQSTISIYQPDQEKLSDWIAFWTGLDAEDVRVRVDI